MNSNQSPRTRDPLRTKCLGAVSYQVDKDRHIFNEFWSINFHGFGCTLCTCWGTRYFDLNLNNWKHFLLHNIYKETLILLWQFINFLVTLSSARLFNLIWFSMKVTKKEISRYPTGNNLTFAWIQISHRELGIHLEPNV